MHIKAVLIHLIIFDKAFQPRVMMKDLNTSL